MDVKVRNKKTGQEKTVPLKVYESLKHVYTKISDGEAIDEDVKKKVERNESVQPVVVKFHPPVQISDGDVKEIQVSNDPKIIDSMDEYIKLTGKKPDGRWGEDKLKAKIEELKENAE